MGLPKNSVWKLENSDLGLVDGKYRVLTIVDEADLLFLFPLNNNSDTARPLIVSLGIFLEQVRSKKISKSEYTLPSFLLVDDTKLSKEYLARRDKNFALIKKLIENREFLFDYASKQRVRYLSEYAKEVGTYSKAIARLLCLYWRYGQNEMALLPAFANSGGLGKDKKITEKPIGAPKQPRTLAIKRAEKYILDDKDKQKFKKALKKYYLKESGLTLSKTYKNLLKDSYAKEIKRAKISEEPPKVPTLKQFTYWSKKLFDKHHTAKSRTSESDYQRNQRAVLSSVTDKSYLIGSHFEIDATVADVHIVSELGAQYRLGRPTIYVVVDRASRMIVGMHVSLFHASWKAARQALANCFLPKADYCRGFGIFIEDSEWPCAHIPKELVCDNGEMIGLKSQKALSPMTTLSFTPPYRPDCKGVVEKCFDILNKEAIHELIGSTRGGYVVRGSDNPKDKAQFTLKEVTAEIIKAVLEHNNTIYKNLAFASPLLIEHNLSPTPLNYWKIHLLKHKHELETANQDEIIAKLLPSVEVSMTRSGVYFNGMYYSNSEIEERNLASIARTSGQWLLEARIDENTTNYIYVRLDRNKGFTRCELLPRSRILKDKSMFESDFILDWIDGKKELSPITDSSIDAHKHRQEVAKKAKARAKEASKISLKEQTQNTRLHRQNELEATTNMISDESIKSNIDEIEPSKFDNKVLPLPRGRKRRSN